MMDQVWSLIQLLIILFGPLLPCLFILFSQQRNNSCIEVAEVLLYILTIWIILQTFLGLILGTFNRLSIGPVILSELCMTLGGIVLFLSFSRVWTRTYNHFLDIKWVGFDPVEMGVIVALAFVATVLFERIATQPFSNFDTLWFHGPIIARWYQTSSFSQLDPIGNWIIDHPYARNYPHSWFVLPVLFLMPFQQDFLAALPMLIAWLALGFSVFLLGKSFGAERFYALSGAALVLSPPLLLNQVTTLHVDLPLAAIFLVSFYYLVTYRKTQHPMDAVLFFATAGLLAGIKTTGLIYVAFLIMLFGLLEIYSYFNRQETNLVDRISWVWPGILAFIFLAGFWYIKIFLSQNYLSFEPSQINLVLASSNSIVTSSNSTPISSQPVISLSKLNEVWDYLKFLQSETLTSYFNLTDPAHWSVFTSQALVRFQLPAIALILQALLMPWAWRKSSTKKHRRQIVLLSLFFVAAFLLYWNTPFSAFKMKVNVGLNMRYGFSAFGALGVVAAVSASEVRTSKRLVTGVVVLSTILGIVSSAAIDKLQSHTLIGTNRLWLSKLASDLFVSPLKSGQTVLSLFEDIGVSDIVLYITFFIAVIILASFQKLWLPLLLKPMRSIFPGYVTGAAIILCIALVLSSSIRLQHMRDNNRDKVYGGIYNVLEESIEPGESIAYLASLQNYLFYGRNLDKLVVNLSNESQNQDRWASSLNQANASVIAIDPNWLNEEQLVAIQKVISNFSGSEELPTPIFGEGLKSGPKLYRLTP